MIPGYLGIDAGGTTTRALLVRADGTCIARSQQAGGNPTSRGIDGAARSIVAAVREARAKAGPEIEVQHCMLAMAGEPDKIDIPALAAGAGLRPSTIQLASDVAAMYFSGAHEPAGTAVIAGTGSVAALIEDGVLTDVAGGAGWLLGDAGSGFWIGQRVVQAAVSDLGGLARPTTLTAQVLKTLGVADRHDLIRAAYAESPVQLAQLAPIAFEQAASDATARLILEQAGEHLAILIKRFRSAGPLVLGGSVLTQGFLPQLGFSRILSDSLYDRDLRITENGCTGASFLALRQAGLDRRASHERIRKTLEDCT
ncbi:N-acetylglucosamine kinase [Kineosporia babensis]|uniref:ATPase BadF/BadG/BcrA/BcrD type domain-containing protein n=1 Tax=Kineosporia babensis TaxID=499548 RepID=A0A9X1NBB3_9ACTN|nr:hypothetical protein [Kineosporia babensis]